MPGGTLPFSQSQGGPSPKSPSGKSTSPKSQTSGGSKQAAGTIVVGGGADYPTVHEQLRPRGSADNQASMDNGAGVGGFDAMHAKTSARRMSDGLQEEVYTDHVRANRNMLVEVQQAPACLSFFVLLGALAAFLDAGYLLFLHTRQIGILAAYQVFFAVSLLMFEAPQGIVYKISPATRLQSFLMTKCAGLTSAWNRGLLMIFQATLWFSICWNLRDRRSPHLLVGVYLVLAGLINAITDLCSCTTCCAGVSADVALSVGPQVGRTENTQGRAERQAEQSGHHPGI